ncbi:unnamed protein product [Knipowitschia caucasica]
MEPALLSSPLGHTQWETEQPFPLGFDSLDSNNAAVLCQNKSGQTGLGISSCDHDQPFNTFNEEDPFKNKVPHLDSLLDIAEFSCGGFTFENDHKTKSTDFPQRSEEQGFSENGVQSKELSDSTLSWLFSPAVFEVSGKDAPFDQSHQPHEPNDETSQTSGSNPQTVNVPSSPTNNINICKSPVLLLDLFSDEHLPLCTKSVTEEATRLSLPQDTVSPDIGDKGLYPDQVTDRPVTSTSTSTQSLPENCLPLDHTSPPEDCLEQSVPLLDIEVPFCNNSLCPASPVSFSLVSENQTGPTVTANPGDVSDLERLVESSPDGAKDDAKLDNTDQNEDIDEKLKCELNYQDSITVLETCPATVEIQKEEHLDTLLTNTLTNEQSPGPNEDLNHLEASDVLDFSGGAEWTKETLCMGKMVGDDSVPLVPAANASEEDVSPLKAVFDALDQDGDGFVRIEEFMEFAAAYGADQVKDLTKFLDPSGLGVISFEDFHRGISAISNGGPEPQLYGVNYSPGDGAVGCPEEYDEVSPALSPLAVIHRPIITAV